MGYLDWIKRPARVFEKNDERGRAWRTLNVYLYRADGRYGPPVHAERPETFPAVVRQIREHVDNKLEVRITNGDDHLLFHATAKGIEWDGIGLTPILDHDRIENQPSEREAFAEWRQDYEMAKERYATGKEPADRPVPSPETGKSKAKQAPVKRVKVRSRDIPF